MSDKKTLIIEATIAAIAKYGLNKTNAQLVAKELNIAQSSIFYHFPQQQKLFDSLIEHIAKVSAAQVKDLMQDFKAANNFDRLCQYIKGNLLWAVNNREHVTVLLYSLAEGKYSPKISNGITNIIKKAEDQLYFYLVAGIAEGEFTINSDLRSLAKFISSSVNGTVVTEFNLQNDWHIDSYMNDLTIILKGIIHLK